MPMQKITLTSSTRECITKGTFLGYEGENEVNKLVFEFTDGFKDGLGVLNIQRGEEYGYVSLEKVEGAYEFPVKSSILSKIGDIRFQVVITGNDGSVIKYDPFTMTVKDAIDAESEMPEEYPSWVDMANAKLAEVDEAIRNTETATKQAEDVANNILEAKTNGEFNGKDGEDGKDGVVGKDGISPTVFTEQTETGAKISITDVNGTHTAEVFNGKDGRDGVDGKDGTMKFEDLTEEQKATLKGDKGDKGEDGFSPKATVTQTGTGAVISVADANGTTTTEISNGKDGANGADGFSPKATVTQTETGAIISVTDVDGTTTAEIFNGKDGEGGGTNNGDTTPIGSVIAHIGMTAPEGYLVCDGAELNIADYADLATHFETQFGTKNHFGGDGITTFAVPDMRNEFLRGYHGDATEQLSGEIGEHQDPTGHMLHLVTNSSNQIQYRVDPSVTHATALNRDTNIKGTTTKLLNATYTAGTTTGENLYYTSRPTNVAVLYCIKY